MFQNIALPAEAILENSVFRTYPIWMVSRQGFDMLYEITTHANYSVDCISSMSAGIAW